MDKLTCETLPHGVRVTVLPSNVEVAALEGALLAWRRTVEARYGATVADHAWRRACRTVVDFERGE